MRWADELNGTAYGPRWTDFQRTAQAWKVKAWLYWDGKLSERIPNGLRLSILKKEQGDPEHLQCEPWHGPKEDESDETPSDESIDRRPGRRAASEVAQNGKPVKTIMLVKGRVTDEITVYTYVPSKGNTGLDQVTSIVK